MVEIKVFLYTSLGVAALAHLTHDIDVPSKIHRLLNYIVRILLVLGAVGYFGCAVEAFLEHRAAQQTTTSSLSDGDVDQAPLK